MKPEYRKLARKALGLPNANGVSCRNRYYVAAGTQTAARWQELVEAGLAVRRDPREAGMGSLREFTLTRSGAELALATGEQLDPKEF